MTLADMQLNLLGQIQGQAGLVQGLSQQLVLEGDVTDGNDTSWLALWTAWLTQGLTLLTEEQNFLSIKIAAYKSSH